VVFLNLTGAVAASIAFMVGRSMSNLYLTPKLAAAVKSWDLKS
jgi:hypothetical protein